jgi:hypothetical protein
LTELEQLANAIKKIGGWKLFDQPLIDLPNGPVPPTLCKAISTKEREGFVLTKQMGNQVGVAIRI